VTTPVEQLLNETPSPAVTATESLASVRPDELGPFLEKLGTHLRTHVVKALLVSWDGSTLKLRFDHEEK